MSGDGTERPAHGTERPGVGVGPQPITLRVGSGGVTPGGELFHRIGGAPTFDRLVRAFYEGVQSDPVIWPMYPAEDLEGAISRLSLFLQQYWGGPTTYSEERGHPRLRMRHMPFRVTPDARDRWLRHMRAAVDGLDLAPMDEAMLWAYLERAAHAMVNAAGDVSGTGSTPDA
ncbi:globin [Curtobacterium sp. MCBD17_034]|uniref:globin n=1 Tax=unclassified Curtobacterium TaxID=257496 RepID=UPI000DAAB8B0|nr:globin [Curtobacterium sp. MCBD17_034]PZF63249.1 globin [Curtobacterium sp. MCBD17_013]PZM33555.1 globin [Curtobacterium sp. MCBD17_031]